MFRAVPLPIIRSLLTVHLAPVYVIQVFKTASKLGYPGPAWKLSSYHMTYMIYTSAKCTVNRLLMMGRGTARNM